MNSAEDSLAAAGFRRIGHHWVENGDPGRKRLTAEQALAELRRRNPDPLEFARPADELDETQTLPGEPLDGLGIADRAGAEAEPTDAELLGDPAEDDRFRLVPLDWEPIVERGIPELQYLSPPYLPARKRIWAVGPANSGKSIWAAYKTSQLTRAGLVVVYISQENGLDEEARRFLRLRPDFGRLRLCVDQGLDLMHPEHVEALLELSEGAALAVLDTLTACWSGDENDNTALAAFDREVMKRIVTESGASPLVLDHTGNPQAFVRRRGVNAPRGASSKGQKTDYLLEFREAGECEFTIEHAKGRGSGHKEARRSFRVVDRDEGALEIVEVEVSTDEEVEALAAALAEKVVEAGRMITKEMRAAAKALGYGAERTSAALERLEAEDPPRVRVGWEVTETRSGRQRAKVWRPTSAAAVEAGLWGES